MPSETWRAYDLMDDDYVRRSERSSYNAFYDRPNTLAALGAVDGLAILDAACGPGVYAEHLVAAGATVTGFDASDAMVQQARRRLGDTARIEQHKLDLPLPYTDESFDRILCALAIHYSSDRELTLREFYCVLRPGGRVVLSTQHPTVNWLRKGSSYFAVQQEADTWDCPNGPIEVTFWREPLSSLTSAATSSGFLIDALVEPRPVPALQALDPDVYERLSNRPDFLILGLTKTTIDQPRRPAVPATA